MRRAQVAESVAKALPSQQSVPASETPPKATASPTGPAEAVAAEAVAVAAPAADAVDGCAEMSWNDGGDEVQVTVRVPPGTKAKHVLCTIKDASLKLEVATLPAAQRVVVDGKLFQEVEASDCNWYVEDDSEGMRRIVICLEKKKKMRWLMLTRND